MRTVGLALAMSLLACGGDGLGEGSHQCTIHGSDYDQSCTTGNDCTVVTELESCEEVCSCAHAAINAGEHNRWSSAWIRFNPPVVRSCPKCVAHSAKCTNGMCGLFETYSPLPAANYELTKVSGSCNLGRCCRFRSRSKGRVHPWPLVWSRECDWVAGVFPKARGLPELSHS
jgi:hypothetical protein